MTRLVLTEEQANVLAQANGEEQVYLIDSCGRHMGWVERPVFSPEEVIEAEKAFDASGPRYTTEQVLAHLRSLAPE